MSDWRRSNVSVSLIQDILGLLPVSNVGPISSLDSLWHDTCEMAAQELLLVADVEALSNSLARRCRTCAPTLARSSAPIVLSRMNGLLIWTLISVAMSQVLRTRANIVFTWLQRIRSIKRISWGGISQSTDSIMISFISSLTQLMK